MKIDGQKLKQARLQHFWTIEQAARQLDVEVQTYIRWEKGRTRPHPSSLARLYDVFHLTPEQLSVEVENEDTSEDLSPKEETRPDNVALSNAKSNVENQLIWNVPANFSLFVGREKEVVDVSTLLQQTDVRLLTLLGSGGIGKTRLSIEVAIQMRDYFEDGICYVPLATLRNTTDVLPAIVSALDMPDSLSNSLEQQVKTFLREKQILLILDNFEHIASAAPLIEELLQDCPYIKVLVTSRHVLQLEAEHTFSVPPLSVPDLKNLPPSEELVQYAAVALFVQRVRTYNFLFKITHDNAKAIAELCVHLDGLPLAIELAAARIKLFSPQVLLTRFLQDQQVLRSELSSIPERHRTLYYTLQWSYDLLNEQEQWLFRHLSVFVGGSSLETIEAFFADTMPLSSSVTLMEIVSSLLNKSLLQRIEEGKGEPRFVMLETIRTYALNCLQSKGELEGHWRAYALYYLALVEQAAPFLKKKQQAIWLAKLDWELDNLRSALQWFIEQEETDLALRFAEAFGKFCGLRGYWHEEQRFLNAIFYLPVTQEQEIRGRVLRRAGHLAYRLRHLAQARTLLEQSVDCSRKVEDWQNLVGALSSLGWVFYRQNELDAAYELLKECVEVSSFTDDYWARANALESLGRFTHYQGQLDEAYALLQESVEIARSFLDKESLARILTTVVSLEVARGNNDQAMQLAQESFSLALELNTMPIRALALDSIAEVALFKGDYEKARDHFEERMELALKLKDETAAAIKKLRLGELASIQGFSEEALTSVQESLSFFRDQEDNPNIAAALDVLGYIKRKYGEKEQALQLYKEALQIDAHVGNKKSIGKHLVGLAMIALDQKRTRQAIELFALAQCYLNPALDMHPAQRIEYEHAITETRSQLSEEVFVEETENGARLTLEQAINI